MENERCDNCKWYEDFTGVCFNYYALHCADFVNDDYSCDRWEAKEDAST